MASKTTRLALNASVIQNEQSRVAKDMLQELHRVGHRTDA